MTNSTSIISMSQTDDIMAMAEKLTKLERDNAMLKQENDRLNRELAKAFYKVDTLKERIHSHISIGQVFVIACVVSALILAIYGVGHLSHSETLLSDIYSYR